MKIIVVFLISVVYCINIDGILHSNETFIIPGIGSDDTLLFQEYETHTYLQTFPSTIFTSTFTSTSHYYPIIIIYFLFIGFIILFGGCFVYISVKIIIFYGRDDCWRKISFKGRENNFNDFATV